MNFVVSSLHCVLTLHDSNNICIVFFAIQVKKLSGGTENEIVKPEEAWTRRLVEDDAEQPMLYYKLLGLMPDSEYQVEIRARNNVGWSLPNSEFIFRTAKGQ